MTGNRVNEGLTERRVTRALRAFKTESPEDACEVVWTPAVTKCDGHDDRLRIAPDRQSSGLADERVEGILDVQLLEQHIE
jgi:hypothetical protein